MCFRDEVMLRKDVRIDVTFFRTIFNLLRRVNSSLRLPTFRTQFLYLGTFYLFTCPFIKDKLYYIYHA